MYFCSMLRVVVVSGGGCREPLKGATLLGGRVHVMDYHEVVQSIRKSNKKSFGLFLDIFKEIGQGQLPVASLVFATQKFIFHHMRSHLTWQLDAEKNLLRFGMLLQNWRRLSVMPLHRVPDILRDFFVVCQGWNLSKTGNGVCPPRVVKDTSWTLVSFRGIPTYLPKRVICSYLIWIG